MKIGIDARMFGIGHAGIGRYVQNLVNTLISFDQTNQYVIFTQDPLHLDVDNVRQVIAAVKHYTVREQWHMFHLAQDAKLDVLHVPHFNIPVMYSGKLVTTIHDILWHTHRGTNVTTQPPLVYWPKYLGYRFIVSRAVAKSDQVIVPSRWVKQELVKRFTKASPKVNVIPEGVDPGLTALKPDPKVFKSLPSQKSYCVYVGSLYPHKNVAILIKAVNMLHAQGLQLVIVTARNAFVTDIQKLIDQKGCGPVHLRYQVSDRQLVSLLKNALCLVQPSTSEGFGLTGLEAMALHTPVISSRASALPETYGKAALYFDPGSAGDLSTKLNTLLTNKSLRSTLVAKGIKQVAKFSWEKNARETLALYGKVYHS
jgi:glycosyltransferase involved in cell wall biosynthesis